MFVPTLMADVSWLPDAADAERYAHPSYVLLAALSGVWIGFGCGQEE